MSNQHTPGPWTVGSCTWNEDGNVCYELQGIKRGSAPDARLIAAAPDLLDALKMGVAETMDYIKLNNLTGAENNHWIVQARAAIAKATGEHHE